MVCFRPTLSLLLSVVFGCSANVGTDSNDRGGASTAGVVAAPDRTQGGGGEVGLSQASAGSHGSAGSPSDMIDADSAGAEAVPSSAGEPTALMPVAGTMSVPVMSGGVEATPEPEGGGIPERRVEFEETGMDSDGDGLDDGWETSTGRPEQLSPLTNDTDGNGVPDGEEDFDGDGLTVLEEYQLGQLETAVSLAQPHPFVTDVLVEVDARENTPVPPDAFAIVQRAFLAVDATPDIGGSGIRLHFYVDQQDLDIGDLDEGFGPKKSLLAQTRGFAVLDTGVLENLPTHRMIHVVIAGRRVDIPSRGGETIGEPAGSDAGMTPQERLDQTGILIFADSLAELFPDEGTCGAPADGSYEAVPDVTYTEAFASTLLHELGHALQLGHDTEANGGINDWNVMSTPSGCPSLRRRIHGEGNGDPTKGSTEAGFEPRFSDAAEALMEIANQLGVDTTALADKAM